MSKLTKAIKSKMQHKSNPYNVFWILFSDAIESDPNWLK